MAHCTVVGARFSEKTCASVASMHWWDSGPDGRARKAEWNGPAELWRFRAFERLNEADGQRRGIYDEARFGGEGGHSSNKQLYRLIHLDTTAGAVSW